MGNPVIIIVGAGPGVGAATARRFATAGYEIALVARDQERLEKLAAELTREGATVGYAVADVADPEALTAVLAKITEQTGRLDVIMHGCRYLQPCMITIG